MSLQEPPKHIVEESPNTQEIAKKMQLETQLSVLTAKVQKAQLDAENKRIVSVLQRLRDRIAVEPVTIAGDLSQEKMLRFVDEEVATVLQTSSR